ncbi:asparagine synthase (glutamine-hydrolyzing) [Sphingomonas sp. LY29]|uniref:asparagine synthase (glutamine-hydrolyzing) n=1 Tax=Sphingomonas sp. LY29 TaxID=3095341 RepID=UPI002D79AA33|nr:asparagine synthase (glutamine-hydrolyzing) [Sphingomonas sp. LY29]WRP26232.1 asparagine synthase (glutamine-hydrolyzing) [Sphingomonas sp. LY29]
MCGIAGLLSSNEIDPALLRRMGGSIAHRGPDDRGEWIDQSAGIGLAHRRLSIVDLSPMGHQPMASDDGRFWLSYNGEIYNHQDLRAEFEAAGAAPSGGWRGHSDTETLLQGIATWGLEATLGRAVGMFAFALWDCKERKLQLVRDRFGEKPLYYGWAGRDFVFASELKAIRVHPDFDASIDRQALHDFAAKTWIPAPRSIYRTIFKLEPGCILTATIDVCGQRIAEPPVVGGSGPLSLTRYWSYADVMRDGLADPIAEEDSVEALERVLDQAIRGQAVADVPVGAFLSGGIDSSAVVAMYQQFSDIPVRTFTIGFGEAGFDEAVYAKEVAAHLGTVHHEHYVSVYEARDVIPDLSRMYDEPFADSSQIPTFLVSRFAKEQVTVALTGDGGDELFAGYNRHFAAPRLWNMLEPVPAGLRGLAGSALGRLPSGVWSKAASLAGPSRTPAFGAKIQKALRLAGSARSLDDVYASFLDEWSMEQSPVLGSAASLPFSMDFAAKAPDTLRMMYCDAVSYLPDDILAKVDRASMAVSLETRVPFLDHRVAAVAARIPLVMKVRGGVGKHVLRELLYKKAPRRLFDRPKAGFAIPVGEWIKGPLRPWAEELLDPARMRSEGFFDSAIVERRWKQHLAGQRDSTQAIWAILMFQSWLRDAAQGVQAEAA